MAAVASLLAFIFYAAWERKKEEPLPSPDADDVKKREDAEAVVEVVEAKSRALTAEQQANVEALRDWDRVVDTTRTHTEEIKDSPGAIDSFLDHTGDNMRK